MRKSKSKRKHHHKIFVAVILVISSLYVFSSITAEAATALPKPTVSVAASAAKVGESKKVVIVAVAVAPNGNPVDKLAITLDGKTQTCIKSYYCRVSFGPFKITKNKTVSYTATATYKSGTKSASAVQKKSLTIVKEKNVAPASVVPVAPVILDQGQAENIPVEIVNNAPTTPNTNNQDSNVSQHANQNDNAVVDDVAKARDTQRISDLKQLQSAFESYHADNNAYPPGNNINLGTDNYTCLNSDGWGTVGCAYQYMPAIPHDSSYGYIYNSVGTDFTVDTQLEGVVEGLNGKIRLTPSGIKKI